MLIATDGQYSGLLSGGCLEGDLRHHAETVILTGESKLVAYDTRGPDDLLWGMGLGCEGAMQILLLRVGPESGWQPLTHLAKSVASRAPTAVGFVTESAAARVPVGSLVLPDPPLTGSCGPGPLAEELQIQVALKAAASAGHVGWFSAGSPRCNVFLLPLSLPPRVLVLGAGPDAVPVVDFSARLSWRATVVDHRPQYAQAARFRLAEQVIMARPDDLIQVVDLSEVSAAVVMSHHLPSDLAYLRTLASSDVPYVGLLGPPARRDQLLQGLEGLARRLRPRLRAPIGLSIGGRTPESIALSIVAEMHAFMHGAARNGTVSLNERSHRSGARIHYRACGA
jgi:xanthine/CO dehydrogenase XdhC/CoxF family maturation factor